MILPGQPPTFRPPTPTELPWWWRFHDADGREVTAPPDLADLRFASRGDAESWVGEVWSDLAEAGVATATLLELDRTVYGPLALQV